MSPARRFDLLALVGVHLQDPPMRSFLSLDRVQTDVADFTRPNRRARR